MARIELRVDIRKGKLELDRQEMKDKLSLLQDGKYVLTIENIEPESNIDDLSKHYFALRDRVFEEGGTGYTREELHAIFKYNVLQRLPITEQYFDLKDVEIADIKSRVSTRWLTIEGWKLFIKHVKGFAWENFNCYL